ncbi:MAG: tetratricopeptide repeat protein [Verrucomicrobiota bacterium]|nr:tetratricopeptide repeat protein [Verrucomicrobiota bacterium]
MKIDNFFAELKRRNVIRMAGLYLVGAWLLVQVAGTVLPMFGAPDWLPRSIVILLAIGFVPAIIFEWAFELTPSGLKRDEEVTPAESIAPQTARRMDRMIIAVLALALLYFGFDKFVLAPRREAALIASAQKHDASPTAAKPSAVIDNKSIAVLPFENLSADKDNVYFATGMQDEILTRLAGIRDLKVISRSSTEQYASRPPNLKIVAEQLGVATVLEGSVQKAGNAVHINVQLLDARNDSHLWAQSYDGDLKDIFGVQKDVAQKVADALKAQLLPAESARIASVPTQNPDAHDLYLRANAHFQRAYDQAALTSKELPPAIDLYQQALSKDPSFALAAAMLAQAHMRTYWELPDRSEARLASAKAAADKALALQPDLGEAHVALGTYWYYGHRDYTQALQQLDLARKSLPNSATIELYVGAILRRQGKWSDAITHVQRAIVLDPRSSLSIDLLAAAYQALRRYVEADEVYARAVAVTQDPTYEQITQAYNSVVWKGDLAPLRAALGSLTAASDSYSGNALSFFQLGWWSRDYPAAIKTAETDTAPNWTGQSNETFPRHLYLAWAYQVSGDNPKAQPLYAEVRVQMLAALQQRPDDPDLHLALGFAAAGLGLKDEAIREGRKATALMPVSRDAFTGPGYLGFLAQLYVRLGENDEALDTLRQLLAVPSSGVAISPALLKLDPVWDPLRKDPRFKALLTKYDAREKGATHE